MKDLTEQDIERLKELEKKATKGPFWYQEKSDAYTHIVRRGDNVFFQSFPQDTSGQAEADARLEAESRNLLPALLAKIQELNEVLKCAIAWAGSEYPDCPPGPLPWEAKAKAAVLKKENGED